ncbi:MAG: FAD-binding oxidoreductase [Deltaproteobacteria bacterium]
MTFALLGRVSGQVYAPGEAGYAQEIAGFNTAIVHTPDLVVVPESARDVVEAVRYAREQGHRVSVQATGHGAHAPITSGLLVSTRRLQHVSVVRETRTARIGAGTRWQALIAAAAEYGLAPIAGSSVTVGVVGYLLGGGLGPLARSHGFGSDYLLGLSVVTGDSDLREADAEQNPDLFWALRGGGKCGLGIVTEVRLRLVELRTLYAGALFFEEAHIEASLRAWVDWTKTADPLTSTSVAIVRFPALDAVPEPFRGRRLLGLRFAYPGPSQQGARLAAPLRSAAPVYLDTLGELAAADIARVHNDPTEPRPVWSTGALLTHVDQQFASRLLEHVGAGTDAPFVAAEIRHLGAATERDVEGGSAVGGRASKFTLGLVSGAKPELFQSVLPAAAERLLDSLRSWVSAETNISFAGRPRSAEHFASAWPRATFDELTRLRRRYDPHRVFAGEY